MELNHKTTMSLNDWREFSDDEDVSLAYGKVTFLSTKPNSHRHVYSEEVIKQYSDTFLGKFLVTDYDEFTMDSTTHTDSQKIVGYFPTNQKILYDRDEEGYLQATADVVISKIYAPEVYRMFKEKNFRTVSVEALVGFTEETENFADGEADKIITGFEGIGVTILGLRYNPSVPTAKMTITKMSKDNIKNIEKEYETYSKKEKDDFVDVILEKLNSIENKLERKEHEMSELKDKEKNSKQSSETEEKKEVEQSSETEEEKEETKVSKDEKADIEEKDEEEKASDEEETSMAKEDEKEEDEDKKDEDEEKMDSLKEKMSELEATIKTQEIELSELREFKKSVQKEKKDSVILSTLTSVKSYMSESDLNNIKNKAEKCSYEEIQGWKNEVLASIAEKALMSKDKEEGIMDMGIPAVKENRMESIFDYKIQ